MPTLATKPGFTAVALAAVLVLLLLATGLAFRADSTSAYFLGQRIGMDCAIRLRFGLPCPACGLARSVALTLHGHLRQSLRLNPGGPLGLLGFGALSLALFLAGLCQHTQRQGYVERIHSITKRVLLVYGISLGLVVLGHWMSALLTAKTARPCRVESPARAEVQSTMERLFTAYELRYILFGLAVLSPADSGARVHYAGSREAHRGKHGIPISEAPRPV